MATALADIPIVILCGGRGARMGPLTDDRPKPLAEIQGRPILWWMIAHFARLGGRHFILPLGYRGDQIETAISGWAEFSDLHIALIDTGIDSPIALRLDRVLPALAGAHDILLANGDTIADIDFAVMAASHRRRNAGVTLCVSGIRSNFGVVVLDGSTAVGFERHPEVESFNLQHGDRRAEARVYTGFSAIRLDELRGWLATVNAADAEFEQAFYGPLAAAGRAVAWPADGPWWCFDTPKDLEQAAVPPTDERLAKLRAELEGLP